MQKNYDIKLQHKSIERHHIIECLFFTLYAIAGTDALISRNNIHTAAYVCVFITVLAGIYLALNMQYFSKFKFYMLVILTFIAIVSGMQNNDFGYGYVLFFCVLLFSVILSEVIRFEVFADLFCKIMAAICLVSIGCYIFSGAIIKYIPSLFYYTNTTGLRFVLLGVTNISIDNPTRNFGAFWEPGAFQFYCNIALLFELFFKKQKARVWFVLIYIVAVATTFSTTGYLVTTLLLLVALFGKWSNFNKVSKNRITAGFLAVLFTATLLWSTIGQSIVQNISTTTPVIGKFLVSATAKTEQDTVNNRIYSLMNDVEVIKQSPLVGMGRTNAYALAKKIGQENDKEFVHNTNTYAILGANFGLVFMLIILIQYIRFFIKRVRNIWLAIMLFLIFSLMLAAEDFSGSLLMFVLFFYSFGKAQSLSFETEEEQNERLS